MRIKFIVTICIFFISGNLFSNTFTVTNTNDASTGSLRLAIQNSNIYPGSHIINFNIPNTDPGYISSQGIWKISLTSTLPIITHSSVLIDGTSQTIFAGNTNPYGPEIMLDGGNNAWADFAFHVYNVSNVTIKGFIIGMVHIIIIITNNGITLFLTYIYHLFLKFSITSY